MTRRKAFTLVEILVTIAIIGMLAALMLPVMARARRYAQRAPCISNLRQLAQAALMYKADHDNGALPPRIEALSQSYIKSPALLQCPLDGTHLGYARSVYANVWPDVPGLRRSYGYVGSLRDPALWGTPNDKPDWENGLALFVCQLHGEPVGTSLSLMEDNVTTARNGERITVFDGLRLRAMPDGSVKIDHFSPHRTLSFPQSSLTFYLATFRFPAKPTKIKPRPTPAFTTAPRLELHRASWGNVGEEFQQRSRNPPARVVYR